MNVSKCDGNASDVDWQAIVTYGGSFQRVLPWTLCRFATLFAIHGRAFPIVPMAMYSSYVVLITVIVKYCVNDFSNYKELLALQYPVQTIGVPFPHSTNLCHFFLMKRVRY